MTKQEEIRKVFNSCCDKHYSDLDPDGLTQCILLGLSAIGVVIKVDDSYHINSRFQNVAVEPLIEGGTSD